MPKAATRNGKLANSSCLPRSIRLTANNKDDRESKRESGTSYVAGKEIDIGGLLAHFHVNEADPVDMADKIEMVTPLMRPFGCGPVAPSRWLVLRTYQRIIEVRDETRMDDNGLAIGDRTFKRCYQRAQRELVDEKMLHESVLDRAGTVEPSFRYITDKLWHRYLFPFGTFIYQVPTNGGKFETNWRKYMLSAQRDNHLVMNPYSVTAADVLYLCNTGGYLDRYLYLIGIILWAKRHGVNLLMHVRPKHSRPGACHKASRLDRFYTLPRGRCGTTPTPPPGKVHARLRLHPAAHLGHGDQQAGRRW